MNIKKSLVWVLLFLASFGCEKSGDPEINDNPPILRELSDGEISLIASSNEFVFDLFGEINTRESGGNFFFSPLSVEYALGMTLNGAGEDTREAIRRVLGNESLNEEGINASYETLTEFLLGIDKTVLLKIANSVWYRHDLTVKEAFKDAVQIHYDAEVAGLDFSLPSAKDEINGWVSGKTEGLIRDLIDGIPADAVMYLINAIYFKADWQYKFDKSLTDLSSFYLEDGNMTEIEMMTSDGAEINYFSNDYLRLVDIPYGNGQYSMILLVPVPEHSLEEITGSLDNASFTQWISSTTPGKSRLTMPKFRIKYKTLLNDDLSNMGMGIAFSSEADFSRLFENPLELMISRVIHQAVIEVNEEGSEAAAATAVEIVETSLPPEPDIIIINRPFIFLIREKHSGTILFAGKLTDPDQLD
ncbi:MAG: serpin family protein [Cyclobacteriaceae bacterium]|nr:serpin family protein [Cyclobacteriaceae bacterium]